MAFDPIKKFAGIAVADIVEAFNTLINEINERLGVIYEAGAPHGGDTEVQYNDDGAFAGAPGARVVNGELVLNTPDLGTPTAVGLVNGVGLPLETGVTGDLPAANLEVGTEAYLTGLPTTLPGTAGRLWNNGGVVSIS